MSPVLQALAPQALDAGVFVVVVLHDPVRAAGRGWWAAADGHRPLRDPDPCERHGRGDRAGGVCGHRSRDGRQPDGHSCPGRHRGAHRCPAPAAGLSRRGPVVLGWSGPGPGPAAPARGLLRLLARRGDRPSHRCRGCRRARRGLGPADLGRHPRDGGQPVRSPARAHRPLGGRVGPRRSTSSAARGTAGGPPTRSAR